MKISKVEFKKLFGIFDHSINFDQNGGVTIIIGENGLGKTVILESLNSLFNRNYSFFSKLTFDHFIITFDTSEIWSFRKGKSKSNIESLFLTKSENGKNDAREYEIKPIQPLNNTKKEIFKREFIKREYMLSHGYPLSRMNNHSYFFDDSIINNPDILDDKAFNDKINVYYELLHGKSSKNPIWFEEIISKLNVKLIETQRIISRKDINSETILNSVEYCSRELKEMISEAVKESSEVASELDSTYPNRLITELKKGEDNSFEDLNKALSKLDDRRKLLSSVGLITDSKDNDLLQIDQEQEDLIKILKIYIDDSHKKLAPFEEISLKIKTFKEIINTRFKHKKLEVTQNEGIIFKSTIIKDKKNTEVNIPSTGLSSGEQNELILFYKLIFNSQKNDLILIDEPELSLHISWQNKFIDDIKDIISINKLSVVIATHSPDIISDNWSLMVELKGVE